MNNNIDRRNFLKALGISPILASGLQHNLMGSLYQSILPSASWDKTLILYELGGGNDGLNTIIPLGDDTYYDARPNLAIDEEVIIHLSPSANFGAHPSLQPLVETWQDNNIAIIHGLGYESPNHSHFRSIDIWETGSDSNMVLTEGWLTRSLKAETRPDTFVSDSIILKGNKKGPMEGDDLNNLVIKDLNEFLKYSTIISPTSGIAHNTSHQHVMDTQNMLFDSITEIGDKLDPMPVLSTQFPDTDIGKQVETLCLLLAGGIQVPIFKLYQNGYDTHSSQAGTHENLLKEMADALSALRKGLDEISKWDQCLVMTYSEFGRRVYENGSGGTDHGTAAIHMMMGGQVIGGFYGTPPSLQNLDNGDLIYTSDYRRLYSTVLDKWLGTYNEYSVLYPSFDCLP